MISKAPFKVELTYYREFKTGVYKYPHMRVKGRALSRLHLSLSQALSKQPGDPIFHATLAKLSNDEKYDGPKPKGNWVSKQLVLAGFGEQFFDLSG